VSYGRSRLVVTLAWVGLMLRIYHESMLARAHGDRALGRAAHDAARAHHGRPAPAATFFRRSRRGTTACARLALVWMGTRAGLEARVIPGAGNPDRVGFDLGLARQEPG